MAPKLSQKTIIKVIPSTIPYMHMAPKLSQKTSFGAFKGKKV
jgi:hypothetical protein